MAKILIVEDEETIRVGLKYYLEAENFEIKEASYSKEAIDLVKNETFDLVLLDINLPDEDGYQTFQKMKEIRDVSVIFLTANDMELSIVRGLDMGADDYITKPFKARELVSRIKNVLRRNAKGNDSVITVRDIPEFFS